MNNIIFMQISFFFVSLNFSLVDGGQRAVIFDRFAGVKEYVVGEGTHFLVPWVQRPIVFDIRSTPRVVTAVTGSKGKYSSFLLCILSQI